MVADAVHSLGDLVSDGVTLAAIRYARLPPDADHPFGHGKYEALGTLGVAGLLVTTAYGIGAFAWDAAYSASQQITPELLPVALAGGVVSIVVKEILYHTTVSAGRRAQSEVTVANAWHHRSDALSSVVAVLGIGGSMCGFPWLDPVAGGVVAAMIARTGLEIGWSSIGELVDRGREIDEEVAEAVQRAATRRKGVRLVQNLLARKHGPFVSLYMNLVVDPVISVSAAAQIEEAIRRDVKAEQEVVQHVFIRIVPQPGGVPAGDQATYSDVRDAVQRVVASVPEIRGMTHFTAHYLSGRISVQLEVAMDTERVRTLDEAARVARRAEAAILARVAGVAHADVHLELRPMRKFCELFENGEEPSPQAARPPSTAGGQCPGGGGLCPPPKVAASGGRIKQGVGA